MVSDRSQKEGAELGDETWKRLILGWIVTPVFVIGFGLTLLWSELFQRLTRIFSKRLQQAVCWWMSWGIVQNLRFVAGMRLTVMNPPLVPEGVPIVLVMNHQSMYDIPIVVSALSNRHVRFIAKKELGRKLPAVSLALRELGHLLIDRDDRDSAVSSITEFAKEVNRSGDVVCIFPEGTRGRAGVLRRFRTAGTRALLSSMPNAVVVSAVIVNSWRLLRYSLFPIPFGVPVHLEFLSVQANPGDAEGINELMASLDQEIRERYAQLVSDAES